MWSNHASEQDVLNLASFLSTSSEYKIVRTWDVFEWIKKYDMEERAFHFTIHPMLKTLRMTESPWLFYPGDCELF